MYINYIRRSKRRIVTEIDVLCSLFTFKTNKYQDIEIDIEIVIS